MSSRRPAGPARDGSATGLVVAVLAVATTAYSLLQSLVVPALASLQVEYDTGPAATAWVFTTYLLSASVLTPIAGRLADVHGRRLVLTSALALLSLGCVISAMAPSLPLMLVGRAVQGSGGAVFPLAFAVVGDVVAAHRRTGVVAALSAVLSAGGAAGTVAAGPVLDAFGPDGLFWVPAAVTAGSAVAAWLVVPDPGRTGRAAVGWRGGGLLAAWLTLLLLGISAGAGRPLPAVGCVAAAATVGVLWWWSERRSSTPLIDPRTLASPQLRAANAATVMLGLGMFGAWMLLPLLAQQDPATGVGLGVEPGQVFWFMLPGVIGSVAVSRLCAPLARHGGDAVPVAVGAFTAGAAYLGLASAHHAVPAVIGLAFVEGLGIGLAFAGVAGWVLASAPRADAGAVAGLNTVARTVGGTLGTTLAGTLLQSWVRPTPEGLAAASDAAYTTCFAVFGSALLVAGGLALHAALPARRQRDPRRRPVEAAVEEGSGPLAHQRRRSAGAEPPRARGIHRRGRSVGAGRSGAGASDGGVADSGAPGRRRSAFSTSSAGAGRANQ